MTYEEAISLYKQGNESGFQYLYDMTYKSCLYVIGEIVKDREEAEDILQDAYINAIQKIDTLKEPEKFPAWFRTIASHLAINQANKNKKAKTVNPTEDESPEAVMDRIINEKAANNQITPEEAYECRETSMLLHELIDDLPEKQRQCIILFYMEDYSIKDIAEACNCKENTVKSRLNYGKKKLEEKTIEMQNKGYVLRGVAPVYLITWLLKADMANKIKFVYSNVSTADFSHAIFSNIVKSGLITTVNSGITTVTGSAVEGSVIKGAVSGVVKSGIHTVAGKIVTGAVVAAIAGGLVTAAVVTNNNKTDDEPTTELTEAVSEESVSTEDINIAAETTSEEVTTEEEATEEVISNNTVTGSLEDNPYIYYKEMYGEVIEDYINEINNSDYEISSNHSWYDYIYASVFDFDESLNLNNVGYWINDIDGNGVPELLIASCDNNLVYGIYTINDNEIIPLECSIVRNRYYYCGDNLFVNMASPSWACTIYDLYKLNLGNLNFVEGIFTTEKDILNTDAGLLYYYSTDPEASEYDLTNATEISESEYNAKKAEYLDENFTISGITPLSEY